MSVCICVQRDLHVCGCVAMGPALHGGGGGTALLLLGAAEDSLPHPASESIN
jgi:hypothetical protein